jgi:hypothetical protein
MRKARLKGKMERVVSLLMVISLLGLSENLMAGERRGAMLIVQKKEGSQENGELIAVKQNSILLLGSSSGTDVSIDVTDINTIKIVKKSRALSGLGIGSLIGGGSGAAIGFLSGDDPPEQWLFNFSAGEKALIAGMALGVVGGLIGLTAGALAGTDKTIQIEGKSDLEIKVALANLRQKARIPDFR